jgi:hypothetical protein
MDGAQRRSGAEVAGDDPQVVAPQQLGGPPGDVRVGQSVKTRRGAGRGA